MIIGQDSQPVCVGLMEGGYEIRVGDETLRFITDWRPGQALVKAQVDDRSVCFQLDDARPRYRLIRRGVQTLPPEVAELNQHMLEKQPPDLSKFLLSPMPGLLVRVAVSEGDEAKAGEELAVVEAMKMENSLRASEDVRIRRVMADEGASLVVDQPIMEFE